MLGGWCSLGSHAGVFVGMGGTRGYVQRGAVFLHSKSKKYL